jgi:vacuolar-type H+-ATPase subunit H
MGVIRVAEKSAIQRIKDLDTERASIFDQAKEEALEKAKAAVAELNALGLDYTLTSGGKAAKAGSAKGKRTIKAATCPICEFQTAPPHDGRTHRNQKKKGPFSAAELKEKGLVKV